MFYREFEHMFHDDFNQANWRATYLTSLLDDQGTTLIFSVQFADNSVATVPAYKWWNPNPGSNLSNFLTCMVLKWWLPTVRCWTIEEFEHYTLKFAWFLQKQTDLCSIHDDLTKYPKSSTIIKHGSRISSVLISNIYAPASEACQKTGNPCSCIPQ